MLLLVASDPRRLSFPLFADVLPIPTDVQLMTGEWTELRDHPVFLLQAAMRLKGKILKKDENSGDRDHSGDGYYYQRSIAIYLREDHSFLYKERTFSSVRAGGAFEFFKVTNQSSGGHMENGVS